MAILSLQINISQKEYEEKFRLYLERLNQAATRRGGRHSRDVMSSPHDETEDHAAAEDDETDLLHFHTFRSSKYITEHTIFMFPFCGSVLIIPHGAPDRVGRQEGVTGMNG